MIPRLFAIGYIVFISIFALDVIGEPRWYVGILVHLIPSFILILTTLIAVKNGFVGGLMFIVEGLVGLFLIETNYLMIVFPIFLIGLLFILNNFFKIR